MEMYVTGIFNSYNIDKDEPINEYLTLDVNNWPLVQLLFQTPAWKIFSVQILNILQQKLKFTNKTTQ